MTKSKNNKGEESLVKKKNKTTKKNHDFISLSPFFRILPVIFSDSPFA